MAGDLSTFNIHDGYVEALVRGMRSGFLTDLDYHHLTQSESLEDIKLNLQETDYDQMLADETEALTERSLLDKCTEKLAVEFRYLRSQAQEPLSTFLDFISYEYMIDNVMLLLLGTLRNTDTQELIDSCNPMGLFDESTMRSICAFESSAKGYSDLYFTVLVDTPVGPFFSQWLNESSQSLREASEVRNVLEEVEVEIIINSVRKIYYSAFYEFVQTLGGETQVLMSDILKVRADRAAISITLNSFGGPLNQPSMRTSERSQLYPSIGYLYPEGTANLADCDSETSLGNVLAKYPPYATIWQVHVNEEQDQKFITGAFYDAEVQQLELAFEGQCHYACFYAYVKLKEQEARNLVYILACVVQGMREKIHNFTPVFSSNAPWRQR
mmetsp:Transcript_19839/g.39688  ORF Transcript_19839/g.39688 Transcript_19839/m.39688 type:complete len:384 (-) Transcript_19839:22-1173(-)